ncbi:MAG: hypothetical protein H7839_04815 [Magnetococcus sp. YQC-5]
MFNCKPTENVAILSNLPPASQGAGTVTTGWVSVSGFHNLLAVLSVGAMAATATLDAKLQQATSAAGAGAKDITGKAITQLTQAGGDGDQQVMINLVPGDLDEGFGFVTLSITAAAAASVVGASVMGMDPVYSPATGNHAGVKEIVG